MCQSPLSFVLVFVMKFDLNDKLLMFVKTLLVLVTVKLLVFGDVVIV